MNFRKEFHYRPSSNNNPTATQLQLTFKTAQNDKNTTYKSKARFVNLALVMKSSGYAQKKQADVM
jgi:hypothetical protein